MPDIDVFGKALGNGYAITAIIGKKDIMKAANGSFISSTFWTERIGSAAALATLNEMEKIKSWKIIDNNGNYIIKNWQIIANRHNIQIDIKGLPSLCNFSIKSKNSDKYKTLITQELLKHRFLSSNTIYSSIAHTKSILNRYFDQLDKIFKLIQKCENGLNIDKLLENNIPQKGFERLN